MAGDMRKEIWYTKDASLDPPQLSEEIQLLIRRGKLKGLKRQANTKTYGDVLCRLGGFKFERLSPTWGGVTFGWADVDGLCDEVEYEVRDEVGGAYLILRVGSEVWELPNPSDKILEALLLRDGNVLTEKDPIALTQMLQARPQVRIPVSAHNVAKAFPELFELSSTADCYSLGASISTFIDIPAPDGQDGEAMWSGFWNLLLLTLPQWVKIYTQLPITVKADVMDSSSSIDHRGFMRDYYAFLGSNPYFLGEFKPRNQQIGDAFRDLIRKHRGSNACIYGDVQFLIAIATAGTLVEFYLLPLSAENPSQIVSFDVSGNSDRKEFVLAFLNVLGWMYRLHKKGHTSKYTSLKLFTPHTRQNPYGDQYGEVNILLRLNHVSKTVPVPGWAFDNYIQMYRDISKATREQGLRNTVWVEKVVVDGEEYIADPTLHFDRNDLRSKRPKVQGNVRTVVLQVSPIGCQVDVVNNLIPVVLSILIFLVDFHGIGYCHYDIRPANVLQGPKGIFVIDLELAGKIGSRVPASFKNHRWRPDVTEEYSIQNDLFMLATEIIGQCPRLSEEVQCFAKKLKQGRFATAKAAQAAFYVIEGTHGSKSVL